MNTEILQSGSGIAAELRNSSESGAMRSAVPRTVADLLASWAENPPREAAMLGTTCARLADYHGASVGDLSIDAVDRERKGFRPFLESRKYGENSIRTYVNHVRLLINYAKAAGWQPLRASSPEWHRVFDLSSEQHCLELARHLATIRKDPREVTFEDVDQWVLEAAKAGLAYGSATAKRTRLWRILRDCKYTKKLPVCLLRESNYGLPIEDFPDELRTEVIDLLEWKKAPYRYDRPKDARHREVTAERLRQIICMVVGYAVNIRRRSDVASLSQLAKPEIIGGFVEWCINERQVKGQTLQRNLRLLAAAFRQYPAYTDLKLDWFKKLLDGIPVEPASLLKQRKAEKYLPYSVVQEIPTRIRARRPAGAKKGRKQVALVVRNELLITLLSVLPWRQRNVRECRVMGSEPNLFKAPLPLVSDLKVSDWVAREHAANPTRHFWQFRFSEEETKTGCAVHALVPKQLIQPLEEYLATFRVDLVGESDPETLFLNEAGNPMSLNQVTDVVASETLRNGGRRVTPHLFRDIAAYAWLEDHPQDYLTLSKMLWHASPTQVIKTYGARFNESNGVCSMEAWLEERSAKANK